MVVTRIHGMEEINKVGVKEIMDVLLVGISVKLLAVLVQTRLLLFKALLIRFIIPLFLPILRLMKFSEF
jgi:hypothetical protein